MPYRIALIPGDGIGKEVIPEGMRGMEALTARHWFALAWAEFPYSCEPYRK